MFLVARGGIEPQTQGFSILASGLLPRHRFAGPRFFYWLAVEHGPLPMQSDGRVVCALRRSPAGTYLISQDVSLSFTQRNPHNGPATDRPVSMRRGPWVR